MFRSGAHLVARRDAKTNALRHLRRKRSELADQWEDINNNETVLERTYRRLRRRPLAQAEVQEEESQAQAEWRRPEAGQGGSPVLEIPE